jgi:hypothetical protein
MLHEFSDVVERGIRKVSERQGGKLVQRGTGKLVEHQIGQLVGRGIGKPVKRHRKRLVQRGGRVGALSGAELFECQSRRSRILTFQNPKRDL